MALDIQDSIGFEWRDNGKSPKGNRRRFRTYLFNCSSCSNIIKSTKCYMKFHTGECNSCSSKKTIRICQKSNRLKPFEAKFNIFKHKCPETNLTYEDYLEFTNIKNCHYCDKIMPWTPFGENNPGFWLDRMDCDKGHVKGNLVVCCGLCNFTKRDAFSYDEFLLLSPALKMIRSKRDEAKKRFNESHVVNTETNDCPSGVCAI